jgi:WavE lipopolysaccharide synthesis
VTSPVDARGLERVTARLFARTSRVVGWGSGSVFDYFHGLYPIRLDYLVDNDSTRWGQHRHGVDIAPPDRLAAEDPATTVIVIFSSSWPDIQRQIAGIDAFISVPASAAFADASVREKLSFAEALAATPRAARAPSACNTVIVQGPVVAGVTAHVLRVLAALHPRDAVLLSTWADTAPDLLAEAAAAADDVVTSGRPDVAGVQNRNYQIVSTCAGIERAIANGAKTILKTRTDLAPLSESLFDRARWWLDAVGPTKARCAGLRDRLIVPSSFTRKFMLYHPSDLVMVGAADDMALYWSAPLDPRAGDLLSAETLDQPMSRINMSGHPAESYLGLAFCRTIGRPVLGTVRDSWAFYRDLFAVVDNDWFDLLWFKNLSIPDAGRRSGVRQMVSQAFWQRLYAGDLSTDCDLADIDPDLVALRALAGAA